MPARTPSLETPAPGSGTAALHLRADGLSFSFPDRRVLTDISLVVPAGRPTGLLGENGSGKSTLLQVLAGRLEPSAGTVSAPGPVGLLHQGLPFPVQATVGEVVSEALSHSRRLEQQLAAAGEALAAGTGPGEATPTPQAVRRYDQLLAEATLADAWNADSRAEMVLAALGLAGLGPGTRLTEISGAQRERLALAHLLIGRPTTWLLDAPTIHLADEGAAFLTGAITSHPGPVLIASHDRAFLAEATRARPDRDPAEPTPAPPAGWVQRRPAGSRRGAGALGAPLPGGAGGAEEAAAGGAGLLRRGPAERRPRRGADGPEVPRRPQRDPGQTPRARVPSTPGPARAGTGAQASRAAASHAAAPCPPRRGRLDRDRAGECAGGPRPGPARTGVAVALGRAAAADHRGERLGQVHPAGRADRAPGGRRGIRLPASRAAHRPPRPGRPSRPRPHRPRPPAAGARGRGAAGIRRRGARAVRPGPPARSGPAPGAALARSAAPRDAGRRAAGPPGAAGAR